MKKVAISLMGLCILYLALVNITPLSKIHGFNQDVLQEQVRVIEMELYPLMEDQVANKGAIEALKKELFWFDLEIKRQNMLLDIIAYALLFLSIAGLLFAFMVRRTSGVGLHSIKELTPTEKYVDEYAYDRAKVAGFPTKEDAILWYKNDKLRICEYCGGDNKPTKDSSPNQIQFCTFYKEVPEGAKDLRIVLGSVWNVIPANDLICSSCAKTVRRG